MPRLTFIFFFCLLPGISLQAQFHFFGIIEDKDGFVNVRNDNKKIIDKLTENHVFFDWNSLNYPDSEWHDIVYGAEAGITRQNSHSTNTKDGQIHKSRIRYLEDLPHVKLKESTANRIVFANDTVSVEIRMQKFRPEKHKFVRDKENNFIKTIDGVTDYWGTDGTIPRKEYVSITIRHVNGKVLEFPQEYLSHLYEPSEDYHQVSIGKNNTLFIQTLNGDGAGGYCLVWTIKDYQVKNQLVVRGF